MPFTPLHIGPSTWLALRFEQKIDLPVFVLANFVLDLEPLLIGLYWPYLWAHGYYHNFLIGSLIAFIWAIIAYFGRGVLQSLMQLLHLPYVTNFRKILVSAILGIWFHILLDAPLDADMHPFFPIKNNPFFGLYSLSTARWLCTLCFIPALLLYISKVKKKVP